MIKILFRIASCLFVLSILSSCTGQVKTGDNRAPSSNKTFGKIVDKLDVDIWAIYQDKNDHYWFGSNGNGVYRFDGRSLRQYTMEDGLVDNAIRGIHGDHLGQVYIETPEGVSRLDETDDNSDGKLFTTLETISPPSNNWKFNSTDLWFNCNGNRLYRYDGEFLHELSLPRKDLYEAFGTDVKGVPFENMNNSPYAVYGINKDKAGNIWLGTVTAGAFRYDGESFFWVAEQELSTLPDGRVPGVRSMIEDKDGNMWLSNLISKYNIIETESQTTYEKLMGVDRYNSIIQDDLPYFLSGLQDDNGDMWMVTYSSEAWMYDGETLYSYPAEEGNTEVLLLTIYKDNHGILWLGSQNSGVFKYNGTKFERFEPMKNLDER